MGNIHKECKNNSFEYCSAAMPLYMGLELWIDQKVGFRHYDSTNDSLIISFAQKERIYKLRLNIRVSALLRE